jgi:hypothetical protein
VPGCDEQRIESEQRAAITKEERKKDGGKMAPGNKLKGWVQDTTLLGAHFCAGK